VNASFVPQASQAYSIAFKTGRYLRRRWDLDWLVNAGRQLGLKRALAAGGRKLPPMAEETRRRLAASFEPDIEKLERLLQAPLSVWR
jgi:hypothetical protein